MLPGRAAALQRSSTLAVTAMTHTLMAREMPRATGSANVQLVCCLASEGNICSCCLVALLLCRDRAPWR